MRNNTPTQSTPAREQVPSQPSSMQRERSPSIEEEPPLNPRPANVPRPSTPPVPNPNRTPAGLPGNSNQRLLPSLQRTPQTSANATLEALRNRRRRPFTINPNSELVGFSRSQNSSPAWAMTSRFTPRPRPSAQLNSSHRGLDHPRENDFDHRRMSPSFTLEINEPIDHHHQRAYKPRTHHLKCELIDDSPQPIPRYFREIMSPQVQNIQLIVDSHPSLTCFPAPIHHFTAHALPNDPMRYY